MDSWGEAEYFSSNFFSELKTLLASSAPTVIQMALVKLSGSQNKTEGVGKDLEVRGLAGVGGDKGVW